MLKKNIYKLLFLLVFIHSSSLLAQQEAIFTQYYSNRLYLNPAFAGTNDGLNIVAVGRTQFLTVNNNPNTQLISADLPLGGERLALGIVLYNDELGFVKQPTFMGSFAYKIYFNSGILSLGIQAGATSYSSIFSNVNLKANPDPTFANNINTLVPRAGLGFVFETKKFYIGLSSPSLIPYSYDEAGNSKYSIHAYLTGGVKIPLTRVILIEPTFVTRYAVGVPFETDLTLTFGFIERAFLGFNFRTTNQFSLTGRFNLSKNFAIGYSYDLPNTNTSGINNAAHEVLLNYNIPLKRNKFVTPRYF